MTTLGSISGYYGKSEYTQYKKAVAELKQYMNDKEVQKADTYYKKLP